MVAVHVVSPDRCTSLANLVDFVVELEHSSLFLVQRGCKLNGKTKIRKISNTKTYVNFEETASQYDGVFVNRSHYSSETTQSILYELSYRRDGLVSNRLNIF